MPTAVQAYGGWVVPIIVAVITWLYQTRRVKVDESDLILSKWKELSENHQADMLRIRTEASSDRERYTSDLERVREELKDLQEEFAAYRKKTEAEGRRVQHEYDEQIKQRDIEIAGLKRTISQISQSTAVQLGRVKNKLPPEEGNRTTDEILRQLKQEDEGEV